MTKRYYAAYGSNLNIKQMNIRCPDAKIVGTSWINDYELCYKGSKTGAYLTIEKAKGEQVPIGVWEVTETDEKALDRYEGYPAFYYKKEMTLPVKETGTGVLKKRKCFIYIMHEDRPYGRPTDSYVGTVLRGYIDFKFDEHYLSEASIKAEEVTHGNKFNFVWF